MKNFTIIFLILFISCNSKSLIKNNQTKLYYFLGKIGEKSQNYFKKIGATEVGFLDEGQFIAKTDDKYTFNEDLLLKEINRGVPDKNAHGIVYINLEMPLEDLHNTDNSLITKAMNYFIKVLKFAKIARPNVKWGFYAIPFTSVWRPSEDFFNKQNKIAPLLKKVDAFFPSLYNFYSKPDVIISNGNYFENNTEGIIKLGIKYKKPVYVFVWHR